MKLCPACQCGTSGSPARCPQCDSALEGVSEVGGDRLDGMLIGGKYRLDQCVGEGAMGWVYRGTHLALESTIAVKLMKPVGEDSTRVARFEQEARAASRLSHPHVLMIYDFGRTAGDLLYIISEFLSGETLGQLLERKESLPIGRVVTLFNQVLTAVEEAHSRHLIHRDLKPDNIMVTRLRSGEDFVKVLDFGIARIAEVGEARITVQGEICGTPAFMAPEQIRGKDASERSDLYSLALILYELLAGRAPFQCEAVMEMLAMQLHTQPPRLREVAPDRNLPEALEAVLERGLAKNPEERFQTVAELRTALFAALGEHEASRIPCRECHQGRPVWSKRCLNCGLGGGHVPALAEGPTVEAAVVPISAVHRAAAATQETVTDPALVEAAGALISAGALRSGAARRDGEKPAPAGFAASRPGLVGRDKELGQVEAFLDGGRRCLEVLAPLGTGKTTLLAAVRERALARGLTVLTAAGDPSLARAPWYPVRSLLAQRLGLSSESPGLGELRRCTIQAGLSSDDVPGLADVFGVTRTTERVRTSIRLRESNAAALRALLGPELDADGLCFLLDDVDEYDGASVALVRRLCNVVPAGRSLVVLAAESAQLPGDGPQASMYLAPLDASALQALVTASLPGQTLSPESMRALQDSSGGNPLHASQTLRLLAEGSQVPEGGFEGLVEKRVELLPERTRTVLQTVCLVGNRARLDLLREVLESPADLDRELAELSQRGFLDPVQPETVAVTHARIADVVRELTPASRRGVVHRRIYRALEAQGAGFLARARHAVEARLGGETLELLTQAGELARHWLDDEGAAMHFRHALHVARWELLLGEDDERFVVLSLKLGEALAASGHFLASEMIFKEALSSSSRHPVLRVRLHRSLGEMLVHRGLPEEAEVALREGLRLGLKEGSPALILELYLDLAEVLTTLGKGDEAIGELDEAVLMISAGQGPAATDVPASFWRLLLRLAELRAARDGAPSAVALARRALQQARRSRELEGEAQSQLALARWSADALEPEALDRRLVEAIDAYRRLGDRRGVAECLLLRARYDRGERQSLAKQARDLAAQVDWVEGLAEATRLLTEAA